MSLLDFVFGQRSVIHHPPTGVDWRAARPRAGGAPVRARVADSDQTVATGAGRLQARSGHDVIVADADGDRSVVRLDIFEKTYEPLGGGLYRKRDDVVLRYFTLDRPALIETMEGQQRAEPGDWIMQGVTGELWPVAKDKALEKYDPL